MATVKVREFHPVYTQADVDDTNYVTPAAYGEKNTPPPIKAMIAGEAWYVEPSDIASYSRFASGRWDFVLKDGRTGRTMSGDLAKLMENA